METKPPEKLESPASWYVFRRYGLLVRVTEGEATLPLIYHPSDLGLTIARQQYLGKLNGIHCFSAEVIEGTEIPLGWEFQGLRRLFSLLREDEFWVAGAAIQIVDWDRTHQYCGRCGSPNEYHARERAKKCPSCGLISYPRIAPAIIVLIEKDDQLLLARSRRHPLGLYSVLAGFVEPGESLEAAVAREIEEEVGLIVSRIRYFGSQPWPFPNSLMIAFTCLYQSGEIVIDEEEMADAQWFHPGELPMIPPKISIARQMIDWFVAKHT